ncbi:hypothetical protein TeGR_g6287, partial [Tetraparma gracilis]
MLDGATCGSNGVSLSGGSGYVSLAPLPLGPPFTVELSFAADPYQEFSSVLDFSNACEGGCGGTDVIAVGLRDAESGGARVGYGGAAAGGGHELISAGDQAVGPEFKHAVAVFGEGFLRLYLDGRPAGSLGDGELAMGGALTRERHWLGRSSSGDARFQGTIKYLKIWAGAALAEGDAAELFRGSGAPDQAAGTPPCTTTVSRNTDCVALTDASIGAAVHQWFDDPERTERTHGHINDWMVKNVTNMNKLFENRATFQDDISSWDVSSVTRMDYIFSGCPVFNSPLRLWATSNVTSARGAFQGCAAFEEDVSTWDVSKLVNARTMFAGCTSFNQNLADWDLSSALNLRGMFSGASSFNQPLNNWNCDCPCDCPDLAAALPATNSTSAPATNSTSAPATNSTSAPASNSTSAPTAALSLHAAIFPSYLSRCENASLTFDLSLSSVPSGATTAFFIVPDSASLQTSGWPPSDASSLSYTPDLIPVPFDDNSTTSLTITPALTPPPSTSSSSTSASNDASNAASITTPTKYYIVTTVTPPTTAATSSPSDSLINVTAIVYRSFAPAPALLPLPSTVYSHLPLALDFSTSVSPASCLPSFFPSEDTFTLSDHPISTTASSPSLTYPPFHFASSDRPITVTLTQTSTDVSASSYPNSTVSTAFTVVDAAPVLSIAGGTSQTIPPNSAFVLDLSGSYDPACPPTSSPEITYFISVQSEPPLSIEIPSNMTESTYTIPADSISGSATLTITMTSTYSTSRSVAATLSLLQASTPIPAISIALPHNPTKLDPTSKLTFHASTT